MMTFLIYVKVGYDILQIYRGVKAFGGGGLVHAATDAEAPHSHQESEIPHRSSISPRASMTEGPQPFRSVMHTGIDSNRTDPHVQMNAAMWGYLRYSFLFFIAMVITWVFPSFSSLHDSQIHMSTYAVFGPAIPFFFFFFFNIGVLVSWLLMLSSSHRRPLIESMR